MTSKATMAYLLQWRFAVFVAVFISSFFSVDVEAVSNIAHRERLPTMTSHDFVQELFSRINCYPEQQGTDTVKWNVTQQECEQRGCTYETTFGIPGVPPCYMATDKIGYFLEEVIDDDDPRIIFKAKLRPLSSAIIFDPSIESLTISAEIVTERHLRIKIEDSHNGRYEVPLKSPASARSKVTPPDAVDYEFHFTERPFTFNVRRKSTGTVLFDTSMGGFVFSDRFLQISTRLSSDYLYGLGEHERPKFRHNLYYKTWAMFARDQGGLGEGLPLYGAHPFYMVLEEDGNAHGVFLLNSNAMEYALIPAPGVIIRTIGGIFDFQIYTGPTPQEVVQQHVEFVGRPYMPPYWSLGFQISRWEYRNLETMKEAVARTRNYSIPLDVIYADIDHMDELKDFTLDAANFGGLPEYFAEESDKNGLRSVIILDPAVTNNASSYEAWQILHGNDTFIKWPDGSVLMGYVWPRGEVAFPDFFLERTHHVWTDLIKRHANVIPFDGLWIDMNEPANFATNKLKPYNYPDNLPPWSLKCPLHGYDDVPYRTKAGSAFDAHGRPSPLCDKTICMEARQNDGAYRHYDVHNLYGWSQSFPTHKALREARPGRRPFVLARSTFAGSGTVVSHWLGDNRAIWEHMQRSIIGMFDMSMFGIPHTGADICGFEGTPSVELCKRWMELGAFYPFSRNHNDDISPPQDPGFFGPAVADSSRIYLETRYMMLPYLYTQFYLAHTQATTVVRPLFFEFPTDRNTWDIDRQFLLGKWFMIAPILEPGHDGVMAYVPKGVWWAFNLAEDTFLDFCSGGRHFYFNNSGPAVLQRGGSIVAFQQTGISPTAGYKVVSTKTTRENDFFVHVVFDCDKTAAGVLFWDDGDSADTVESGRYWIINYNGSYNETHLTLEAKISHHSVDLSLGSDLVYSHLTLSNVPEKPLKPTLRCSPFIGDNDHCPTVDEIAYDDKKKTVTYSFESKLKFLQDWSLTASFV